MLSSSKHVYIDPLNVVPTRAINAFEMRLLIDFHIAPIPAISTNMWKAQTGATNRQIDKGEHLPVDHFSLPATTISVLAVPLRSALSRPMDEKRSSPTTSDAIDNSATAGVPNPNATGGAVPRPINQPVPSSSSLHPRTCHCADGGKNLVVCIDGTSNQFGEKNTNVIELYKLIMKEVEDRQCTYYNSGIGTYAQPSWKSLAYYKQVLGHKIDLVFALHFESILLDAYRWISETYERGDRIFLFGFSRGAYQVRTLSAMLHKVGLIHRGNEKQIPFAYQLYSHNDFASEVKADLFKKTFSRDVKVHFVGAWDTVSSVGIVRGHELLPGTADGMRHWYACGGVGPLPPHASSSDFSDTKEVWFAGTHSDIGGGNVDNLALNNTRPALRWMYSEASIAGLHLNPFERKLEDDKGITVNESLTGYFWWLLEYLPLRRPRYATLDGKGKSTTRRCEFLQLPSKVFLAEFNSSRLHRGEGRVIQEGQKVHPSVWLSEDLDTTNYMPCARLPSNQNFWSGLKSEANDEPRADGTYSSPWKEADFYDMAAYCVERYFRSQSPLLDDFAQRAQLKMINALARSGEGRRTLLREVINRLKSNKLIQAGILCNVLDALVQSSDPDSRLPVDESYRNIRSRVLHHLGDKVTEDHRRIAWRFLNEFTDASDRTVQVLTGHLDIVYSVAFSPDGTRIISGSHDRTIRIWDAETGQMMGKPLEGHTDFVRSVAFSPDGTRIASGSEDETVRIWDAETGQAVGNPLEGHTAGVCAVAFSPVGTRIVSGSRDGRIQIWDAKAEQAVGTPLEGHTADVLSVAFSPDGNHIASGSYDDPIRIWDAKTGSAVGAPLTGHTDTVYFTVFSPDSKHIVSGADDRTILIWDAQTGQLMGAPLKGHTGPVYSGAFSPDGTRIVSGSPDGTIRIWDAKTGQVVGKPLEGHTDWIHSVAFSSDGTRIVSGSYDKTIRVWDVLQEPSGRTLRSPRARRGSRMLEL
ncbi:WD40 repeat-like protein [Peniophora sp. CONT]|nr:WD40 repeat-like protein [Peniophora sp. CONT]